MTKPFDPTKPVRYVEPGKPARPARIVSTDRKDSDFPIVALVEMSNGEEEIRTFRSSGKEFGRYSNHCLKNIPVKRVGWVNVYPNRFGVIHETRSDADRWTDGSRIACIKIECEEGEGL